MIKCRHCKKEVVIHRDNRVYAIEEGKLGSLVCQIVMDQTISHLPTDFYYNGDEDAKAN